MSTLKFNIEIKIGKTFEQPIQFLDTPADEEDACCDPCAEVEEEPFNLNGSVLLWRIWFPGETPVEFLSNVLGDGITIVDADEGETIFKLSPSVTLGKRPGKGKFEVDRLINGDIEPFAEGEALLTKWIP